MAPIDSPRPSDILLRSGKQSPQHSQHRKGGLDPCKVLDPKRKTLQSLDAERIMTVFQEAVKRLEITTVLPKVLETLPRFSVVLGQELMTHMERHLRLQDRFTEVTSDLNTLVRPQKDESNQPELEQLREDMLKHRATIIAQGIKNSLRDILRCFKKNPKSTEAILSSNLMRNVENSLLMESLTSLITMMRERLLTTSFEQHEKMTYLSDVIKREKKTHSAKEKLQQKYNEAIQGKEAELLQKLTLEKQRKTLTEALKQTSLDSKVFKTRVTSYHEDILGCRKKIKEDRIKHRENETHLRKTDKAELAKLQALFEILEKQYNAIMEERRLQEEENARRQREEQEQTNAVTTIQAAWRAYQFRKAMAKKVKKDKKAEKKGKENK
ncbi:Dynein regulatory complex protein 10 [Acropora cervicornis]|uniref:Dynein regulatory complex protein 10 n=1 Tax=Acropora cervicornis TaxID=6130 RepID=A0AAD9QR28_ACRCE|nr:Dynein regulatory complex protein 10 [Acropora cervicornis]